MNKKNDAMSHRIRKMKQKDKYVCLCVLSRQNVGLHIEKNTYLSLFKNVFQYIYRCKYIEKIYVYT